MITKSQKKNILKIKEILEDCQARLYELGDDTKRESLTDAAFNLDESINILSSVLP